MPKGPEPFRRPTPCGRFPERCQRRETKVAIFDADDTIWHITPHAIASSVCGPFKKIDEDTVEATTGSCHGPQVPRYWDEPPERPIRVTLLPGLRDTLKTLKMMGIDLFVSSLNTPGSVKDILDAFGLVGEFKEIRDTWDPKDKTVRELAEKHKFAPCDALFLDDNSGHVDAVSKLGVLALQMGVDVTKVAAILDYIR